MDIEGLTTSSLRKLHNGLLRAMATDDALPKGQKPYLIREYADWRSPADRIEDELWSRGERFLPLAW